MKQGVKDNILKLYPLPYILRFVNRKRLKNENFTIFSSNCMGGIIYHLLNKKFLSPTVNLRIDSKEFIKFLNNIHYYLSLPLNFVENADTPYPLGKLGDVTIHFNHYHTQEEARSKWEDRKKRINWDNVYVITNDLDGVTKDDILSLKNVQCNGKIVFTHNDYPGITYTRNIGSEERLRSVMDKSYFTGLYDFETWFNYIKWLNTHGKQ